MVGSYRKPLSLHDLPTDPWDFRALEGLSEETLQLLVDPVYRQLDTPNPPASAFNWYCALSEELERRAAAEVGAQI